MVRTALRCYPFGRGQGRIIEHSFLSRLRFDTDTLQVTTSDGFPLTVFPNELIGRHIALTGQFDRTIVEVLLHDARPGDRILDVGANVGYVSAALLHRVPHSTVIAVEPQQRVFDLLQRNLAQFGSDRSRLLRAAVSDHSGCGVMWRRATNLGASHLVAADEARFSPGDTEQVPLLDGPMLLAAAKIDRIDLVKIDVEGHEDAVLHTLAPALRSFRPRAVVFECHTLRHHREHGLRSLWPRLGYDIFAIRKSLFRWCLQPLADVDASGLRAADWADLPQPRGTNACTPRSASC